LAYFLNNVNYFCLFRSMKSTGAGTIVTDYPVMNNTKFLHRY